MIDSEEFSNRLKLIMDTNHISATLFAEKLNVPRSSISHLLSGRNKPSLEFVLKVLKNFPDVELYWLLNGDGVYPMPLAKKQDHTFCQCGLCLNLPVQTLLPVNFQTEQI